MPFPAPPPLSGWRPQATYFLGGMGIADGIAILLALYFAIQTLFYKRFIPLTGVISLTAAITSALVFAVGTAASGAWTAHPLGYALMGILFAPLLLLYRRLIAHLHALEVQ